MTTFVETNALLACLGEDEAEAERIVKEMFPHERRGLADAAELLADICNNRCAVCDERMLGPGDPRGHVSSYPNGLGMGRPRIVHRATCPLPTKVSQ
jgi:hypothetical protein